MTTKHLLSAVLAAMALLLAAIPAGAQAPESSLNLNAYYCPAGYDQVSDCTRLADVYVNVKQDGQPLGQVVTRSDEAVTLDLMWGAFVELEIAGGVPERATLEDAALSFDAAEGANAVTLIFVAQDEVPDPHSDTNAIVVQALLCPAGYSGNNFVADCPGEAGIEATVTRDADGFSVSDVTGADGIVGFQGLGEGTYTIELGVPGDFANFMTVCGTPDGFEPREVTNPDSNRIGVYAGPTEQLTCTFFIFPVDASGEPTPAPSKPAPAPTKPAPAAPVTGLPSTGTGTSVAGGNGMALLALMVGSSALLGLGSTWLLRHRA
jgi:hypothetical protein